MSIIAVGQIVLQFALNRLGAVSVAAYAAAECSALYISAGSMLTDQIDVITSAATAAGKVTVGGDATLGQSTLVSMYADPYAQGYAAGKQVYRILVNGDDPGAIAIDDVATEDNVKLYNGNVAATLGLDFPKSFKEIHEYEFKAHRGGVTLTR